MDSRGIIIIFMIDQICSDCHSSQSMTPYTHSKISLGFAYHLAQDLQFSFQSVALLVDFAKCHNTSKILLSLQKIAESGSRECSDQHYQQHYFQMRFQSPGLTLQQSQQLARAFYSTPSGLDLVLGVFGLGKTGILVSNNGQYTSVLMFSVDDRIYPVYFKEEAGLGYVEDNHTKGVLNLNGGLMREVILGGLKIYHGEPQKLLECADKETKILIFHPKIFLSSNKLMFYEIRESNFGHDIDTHYNAQKIQFLNKLGYEMSIHSQFRLSCYLSCLNLQSPFPIIIGGSDLPICKTTYLEYLQRLRNNGVVTKLPPLRLPSTSRIQLFQATDKYFIQNNGILLYWRGRLINRYEVEFGRMMESKFYKKRYRSPPQNIWNLVGIVELEDGKVQPNLLKNRFVNSFLFRRFLRDMQGFIDGLAKRTHPNDKPKKDDCSDEEWHSEPRKRTKRGKSEEMD